MGLDENTVSRILLYPSGRPRVTMTSMLSSKQDQDLSERRFLWSPDPVLVSSDWLGKTLELNQPCLIPVARYGEGMSRGLFLTTKRDEYCGTFYYYESGSNILLRADRVLVVPNKIIAHLYLVGVEETLVNILSSLDRQSKPTTSPQGVFHDPWPKTHILDPGYTDWQTLLNDMLTGRYVPTKWDPTLYAMEDRFDQPICRAARDRGFDVVLLTFMTGGNRMVSEVLDDRDRRQSFDSLIRVSDERIQELLPVVYETIVG